MGDLMAGDVMLVQKIALETDERAALAVAVKYQRVRSEIRLRAHASRGLERQPYKLEAKGSDQPARSGPSGAATGRYAGS
jgi:hypothetical protein